MSMTFLELDSGEREALRAICRSVNRSEFPPITRITLPIASLQACGLVERCGQQWRATNRGMDIHTKHRIEELTT